MHGLPVSTGGVARGPHGPEDTAGRLRVGGAGVAGRPGPPRSPAVGAVPLWGGRQRARRRCRQGGGGARASERLGGRQDCPPRGR